MKIRIAFYKCNFEILKAKITSSSLLQKMNDSVGEKLINEIKFNEDYTFHVL